jgi:hypothetical protein
VELLPVEIPVPNLRKPFTIEKLGEIEPSPFRIWWPSVSSPYEEGSVGSEAEFRLNAELNVEFAPAGFVLALPFWQIIL